MDSGNAGGGGFNKDRNNQMKMKGESDGMFAEMGTFGQPNGAIAEGPNSGTQETGIIEKLLVSERD